MACASTAEKRSLGEGIDDSVLLTKVKSKLLVHDEMKGARVNVDIKKAVVTLKGSVVSEKQKGQAVAIAQGVKGVKAVQSELAVMEKKTESGLFKKKDKGTVEERDLSPTEPSPPAEIKKQTNDTQTKETEELPQETLREDMSDEELGEAVKEDQSYWTQENKDAAREQ